MSVLADYSCAAHGNFESRTGHCPYGCGDSVVQKVFLKAAVFKSNRTVNIDRNLQALADDFKLTDLNNQNGTSAVIRPDSKKVAARDRLLGKLGDTTDSWKQVTPGGTYKVGSGPVPVEGRAGAGAEASIRSYGSPGNALQDVQPVLTPPRPLVVGRHDAKIEAPT